MLTLISYCKTVEITLLVIYLDTAYLGYNDYKYILDE